MKIIFPIEQTGRTKLEIRDEILYIEQGRGVRYALDINFTPPPSLCLLFDAFPSPGRRFNSFQSDDARIKKRRDGVKMTRDNEGAEWKRMEPYELAASIGCESV